MKTSKWGIYTKAGKLIRLIDAATHAEASRVAYQTDLKHQAGFVERWSI